MKIVLLCASDVLAFPTARVLYDRGFLVSLAIAPKYSNVLKVSLKQYDIPESLFTFLSRGHFHEELRTLLVSTSADAVFVITFPYRISEELLHLPRFGFFNFHPGRLPEYMGADPVFWQLRNMEKSIGISVHKMTAEIDAGPVVLEEEMPIFPGETYGLLLYRLGSLIPSISLKVIERLPDLSYSELRSAYIPKYFGRPGREHLTIRWDQQPAEEIGALVDASNPGYGGAIATIRNSEMRILEVAPVDIADAPDTDPGTIIYADTTYGLIVSCIEQQFIKINVVHIAQGYISGIKLFNLGFNVGDSFFKK